MDNQFFLDWLAGKTPATKGGPGSGYFGHAGRPGKRGGSAPNKSGGGRSIEKDVTRFQANAVPKPTDVNGNEKKVIPENAYVGSLFDLDPYTHGVTLDMSVNGGAIDDSTPEGLSRSLHLLSGKDPITGFEVEIKKINTTNDNMWVHYVVKDKDGRGVGDIELSFDIDHDTDGYDDDGNERDRYYVNFSALDLIDMRGGGGDSGFGTRWVEHYEDFCWQMGASAISLHANINVGGYYWARIGYDFQNDRDISYFTKGLTDAWNRFHRTQRSYEKMEEILRGKSEDGDIHSWTIASFGSKKRPDLGKGVMLGSDWMGFKTPSDYGENEGQSIGEEYYAIKRAQTKKKLGLDK